MTFSEQERSKRLCVFNLLRWISSSTPIHGRSPVRAVTVVCGPTFFSLSFEVFQHLAEPFGITILRCCAAVDPNDRKTIQLWFHTDPFAVSLAGADAALAVCTVTDPTPLTPACRCSPQARGRSDCSVAGGSGSNSPDQFGMWPGNPRAKMLKRHLASRVYGGPRPLSARTRPVPVYPVASSQ
jgi:hypothetical protein